MQEKEKVAIELRSNETDYFVLTTNIGVVIILFLCVFIYFLFENKLEVANNLFVEQAKLLLILFLSCLWSIPIFYKNHKQSKLYIVADLTRYILSMLFSPFYIAYLIACT